MIINEENLHKKFQKVMSDEVSCKIDAYCKLLFKTAVKIEKKHVPHRITNNFPRIARAFILYPRKAIYNTIRYITINRLKYFEKKLTL